MSLHVGSGEDFVDEEIPLDHAVIDQTFRRSLKILGIKSYLQKLQDITDFDIADEQLIASAFASFAKQLSQQNDGYKSVSLDDFINYGLKERHIAKLRCVVHQLDNESPKFTSKGHFGNKNSSTPDDYPDDFEVEEDNDILVTGDSSLSRGSDEFYRGGKGVLATTKNAKYAHDAHDELEIIDDEEDHHHHQQPKQRPIIVSAGTTRDSDKEVLAPKTGPFSPAIDEASGGIGLRSSTASGISGKRRKKNSSWIREGRWKRGEAIGRGSFGEVYKAMNDKGKLFAVKQLNMAGKQNEVEDLLREIETMKELEHPNIVAYVGACVDEDKGFVYIFQEWVPGGSVAHLLKNFGTFDIGTIRSYTRQILHGLVYLHENGIVHRDIKGGNVLVDDTGTVKLADFGASTKLNFGKTQNTTTVKGTPYFMAPETLSDSKYGRKGDIWAVGCTIIQMLTGDPPWKDCNLQNLVQLHMHLLQWNGPPVFAREVPREVHACLERCFAKDAEKRPSAVELLECSYLQSGDDLDESSNSLAEQLGGQGLGGAMGPYSTSRPGSRAGIIDDDDQLEDSTIMLKQQISRAVSRASLSVQERAGMANLAAAKPLGHPNAGAGSSNNPFAKVIGSNDNTRVFSQGPALINGSTNSDSGANDSTMADIEKQLQLRKEKQQRSANQQQQHQQSQQPQLVGGQRDEHPIQSTDAVFYARNANQSALRGGTPSAGPMQTSSSVAPSSSSSNPFAKGMTAIGRKSMSPAVSNPQQQQPAQESSGIARSSSHSPSSESHSRPQSLSPAFERRSNSHSGKDRDKPFPDRGRDNGGKAAPGEGIASRITADEDPDDRDNRYHHRSSHGQPHHQPLPRSREHSNEPVGTVTPPRHNSNNNDHHQYYRSQQQHQGQRGDTDDDDDDDNYEQEKDDRSPPRAYRTNQHRGPDTHSSIRDRDDPSHRQQQQQYRHPTNSDSQTDDSSNSSHHQRNRRYGSDSSSRDIRDRESKHSGDRQRRGSDSDWEQKDEQSAVSRGRGAAWWGQNGESHVHGGSPSLGMIGQQPPARLVTGATVRRVLGKDDAYDDRDRNRDGQDQQRLAPALKKKLATVRSSMGSASTSSLGLGLADVACSGLDGVRSRPHNDWDRDTDRERGIAGGNLARNRHGYSYHDAADGTGDLDLYEGTESDVVRTGPDGRRRAATSSSAVRSHAPVVPEKRLHTAGASVPISGRSNNNNHRYDHRSSPSDDRRARSPAALGRYAPRESATTVQFNSDDDTAEEGSDQDGDISRSRQQQQQRFDSWSCAIQTCRYLNNDPDYFDACEKCGVKRGGGKSIHQLGKR